MKPNQQQDKAPQLIVISTEAQQTPVAAITAPLIKVQQQMQAVLPSPQQAVEKITEPLKQATQQTSLGMKLVGGAIAGITGTCVIYPLDMVKTRLQNQARGLGGGSAQYRGGFHAFQSIVQREGFRGLYRGLPANLVGITPEKAIKLAVNDYAREALAKRKKVPTDELPLLYGMAAGAFAGFCQVIATNPMEMVKINSQMQGQLAAAGGKAKTSWEITKELGLRGLYKGTPATLMRDVPFSFIFFPASAYFKQAALERDRKNGWTGKPKFGSVFWSGIAAGVIAAASVTPADVIKTRLQTKGNVEYRGIAHCASEIYAKEGVAAFFKGAPQRVMIIAPLFGITLLVYEAQQRWYSSRK